MPVPSFKNILVSLIGDPQMPSAALNFAFDLAKLCDGHLTVHIDAADDMPVGDMNYEAAFAAAAVNDRTGADVEDLAERIRVDAKTREVSCRVMTWMASQAALRGRFVEAARTHDMTILDTHRSFGIVSGYIEAALFETGRPVMVIPSRISPLPVERCLVAWDGSAEAARAVNDAMPLLRQVAKVDITTVGQEHKSCLEGIGLHMLRHNINAELVALPVSKDGVAATLIARIHERSQDLLVMGGHSHSRFREWILGGTTRSMLTACPVALFMSH